MLAYLDSVRGEVVGHDRRGCYVRLETEDPEARCGYYYGNGREGDQVLVSVKRASPDRYSVLCVLESVLSYAQPDDRRAA